MICDLMRRITESIVEYIYWQISCPIYFSLSIIIYIRKQSLEVFSSPGLFFLYIPLYLNMLLHISSAASFRAGIYISMPPETLMRRRWTLMVYWEVYYSVVGPFEIVLYYTKTAFFYYDPRDPRTSSPPNSFAKSNRPMERLYIGINWIMERVFSVVGIRCWKSYLEKLGEKPISFWFQWTQTSELKPQALEEMHQSDHANRIAKISVTRLAEEGRLSTLFLLI